MQCLNPIHVKNKSFAGCVPCGRCPACRQRRSNQWIFRLEQEAKHSKGCLFLTLTYDEDNVPFGSYVDNETGELFRCRVVDKTDIQSFFHDLRRALYGDFGGDLRYFVASEYGPTTLRPHYHVILFNFPDIPVKRVTQVISDCWSKGFVQVSTLNNNRIRYVCKYCLTDMYLDYLPCFNLMSKGIGRDWLSPQILFSYRHHPRLFAVNDKGFKILLPRYYQDKLWPNKFARLRAICITLKHFQDEQRSTFEDYSQNIADSFGSYYQIDRCQGAAFFGRERNGPEIAFGPQGAWLVNYYSKLKRSKFVL